MAYKEKLQFNNTELNANNVDIQTAIDMVNALPEATSGAEVVTGVYTLATANNSITVPGLVGKENFSLAFHGSGVEDMMVAVMLRCQLDAKTSEFVYECYYYGSGYSYGNAIAGQGATTWDSSTGTLTRTTTPQNFPAGDWYYIGW